MATSLPSSVAKRISRLLQQPLIHRQSDLPDNFRSFPSVNLKYWNLYSAVPSFEVSESNGGKIDKWVAALADEYPEHVRTLGEEIVKGLERGEYHSPVSSFLPPQEMSFQKRGSFEQFATDCGHVVSDKDHIVWSFEHSETLPSAQFDFVPSRAQPITVELPPSSLSSPDVRRKRRVRRMDFEKFQQEQKRVGDIGEKLVLEYERLRLTEAGFSDLGDRIIHVSRELGDGAGYDVHSYETDGTDRFIEVKTTTGPSETPFHVSINELEVSKKLADKFVLYRLFDLDDATLTAKMFAVRGPLDQQFHMDAVEFLISGPIVLESTDRALTS